MARGKLPITLFGLFLIYYIYDKYMGQPPERLTIDYGLTIAFIVFLTAILPFVIAFIFVRRAKGNAKFIFAVLIPTLLSAIGYAVFFYTFVAPNAPGVSVTQVVLRSIVPGLAITVIFFVSYFFTKSRSQND